MPDATHLDGVGERPPHAPPTALRPTDRTWPRLPRWWKPAARLVVLGAAVAATWWWASRERMPPDFRFRVVDPGRLYRSGQMDLSAFEAVIRRHGIRTIVNLRAEDLDPRLGPDSTESGLCRRLGVQYIALQLGDVHELLPKSFGNPGQVSRAEPSPFVSRFFKIVGNPANGPVLVHCWGGIHRTGVLVALYRMEYQHWPVADTLSELDDFGYDLERRPDDQGVFDFLIAYERRSAARMTGSRPR